MNLRGQSYWRSCQMSASPKCPVETKMSKSMSTDMFVATVRKWRLRLQSAHTSRPENILPYQSLVRRQIIQDFSFSHLLFAGVIMETENRQPRGRKIFERLKLNIAGRSKQQKTPIGNKRPSATISFGREVTAMQLHRYSSPIANIELHL